jgi:hypothetical protein
MENDLLRGETQIDTWPKFYILQGESRYNGNLTRTDK